MIQSLNIVIYDSRPEVVNPSPRRMPERSFSNFLISQVATRRMLGQAERFPAFGKGKRRSPMYQLSAQCS